MGLNGVIKRCKCGMDLFRIKGLSLFSGIGGIDIALQDYVRPIAYCEIDTYCQGVLLSRMSTGDLRIAPIWDDIRSFNGTRFKDRIDIIFGGFPCQDISVAGTGKGLEGERSGLFFEIVRLAKEIKPKFLFLENVPAITTRGGLRVVREIAKMGYDCRFCVISASSVGALHRRERFFLLAHSKHNGTSSSETRGGFGECALQGQGTQEQKESIWETERASGLSSDVAYDSNTNSEPSEQTDKSAESEYTIRGSWGNNSGFYWPFESREHWQETVSGVCRTSDGISFHVDRLRALGNSVCTQQTKKAFEILMGINNNELD